MEREELLAYSASVPESSLNSRPRICPFCGGLLIQLSNFTRCIRCLFEFCDECSGAGRED
jgi:hypothetical protein